MKKEEKSLIEIVGEKTREVIEKFRQRATPRIPMKVCMMGPRSVGKTTILTAVFCDTQENLGVHTELLLQAEGDTSAQLTDKQHYLEAIFVNRTLITDRPVAGLAASSTVNTFDFVFGLKGKEPRIELEIKDFPGEFVLDKPEEVKQFINESSAILVAIDTPHLMEEEGDFCEAKNKPSVITRFFKEQKNIGEKLILFVPLKCERYYYENRMDEVLSRVEMVYADLIADFKKNEKVACAVTPILTLGDVELDQFKKTEGIVGVDVNECPTKVLYRFKGDNPKYNPAYCVQPLYYTLSFLASQYGRAKRNRKIIDKIFASLYSLFDSDERLFDEILKMEKYRKTDLPGYKVECGSNLFKFSD